MSKSAKTILALFLLPVVFGLRAPAGFAAEPPQLAKEMDQGARVLYLSLRECLCIALQNNLDIEIQSYFPEINDAVAQSQRGVFDPHVFVSATYIDVMFPLPAQVSVSTGGLQSVTTKEWLLSGGITGAIPTGLTYDATISSDHTPFSTITDFFGTNGQQQFQTTLNITQPLLKNFGIDANTTGIRVAVKNKEASVYELEQRIMETLFAVEEAYWNLVFSYENLDVKKQSLKLAQNLLEQNRIRLEVGVIAPLDVLQSETGVAFREEEVIVAQSVVYDARDRLIQVMNLFPDQLIWDVEIVPTDAPSALPPPEYSEAEQMATALAYRPELKQLLKQQEAAELGVRFAKNQLLPSLNLNASVGLIGLDYDFNSSFLTGSPVPPFPHTGIDPAFDDLFSGDNFQWMVGFTFELPWGRHFERGQYKTARVQLDQLEALTRSTRLLIIQDLREALRRIRTSWELVVSTRATTEFRRQSLVAERKKYDVGATTAFDLLQFENEWANARAVEFRALTAYNTALSNLRRANGMLLKYLNVQVSVDP